MIKASHSRYILGSVWVAGQPTSGWPYVY
jgi:hypothetical protein